MKNFMLYNSRTPASFFRHSGMLLFLILAFWLSCKSGDHSRKNRSFSSEYPEWATVDRQYERTLDSIVYMTKIKFSRGGASRNAAFDSIYTERDSFSYQLSETGDLIYGSVMFRTEETIQWLEYYLQENELIYSRHRAWFSNYFWGYAEEYHIYLREGEPVYAKFKKAKGDMKNGGPGEVWLVNAETYRGPIENLKLRLANWDKIKKVIERDMLEKNLKAVD